MNITISPGCTVNFHDIHDNQNVYIGKIEGQPTPEMHEADDGDGSREDRICHCVEQLIDEDVIRKKGDLAAIRQVLLDKGYYGDIQTTKFVQLLKKGCSPKVHDMLPSDSMLRKVIISGKYPEWRITDGQPDETARLVEVARRFLAIFE